ncbi:hypothetical protein B0H14DRAFT_3591627 [Mycena olivaceomarginata]|nr:hypothetical protein B0H14DRAFT_3591627 [Mycena olivaceomarginata]
MAFILSFVRAQPAVAPDSTDPDRPICGGLTKTTPKPARAGLAMILYVRSAVCLRNMISQYLADWSAEALSISYDWCYDRPHPEQPEIQFDKRTFFPGRFIYEEEDGAIYAGDADEPDRVHLNPQVTRKRKARGLSNCLAFEGSFYRSFACLHPDRMKTVGDVTAGLEETEEWTREWGTAIIEIITNYDAEISAQSADRPAPEKRGKVKENEAIGMDTEYVPRAKRAKVTDVLTETNRNARRSMRITGKSKQ